MGRLTEHSANNGNVKRGDRKRFIPIIVKTTDDRKLTDAEYRALVKSCNAS